MKWKEVSLKTSTEAADAGANIFFDLGAQGVVVEDPNDINRYIREEKWDYYEFPGELPTEDCVVIKGYLPDDDRFEKSIKEFYSKVAWLRECFSLCTGDVTVKEIDDEDWSSSWKKFYKTTKIGNRMVIQPEWEQYTPNPGELVIKIDPGAAFGTGTHATTVMCIELLEKYLEPGSVVFDVGCGSGILSIAAVKLGAPFVLARDIDQAAVRATRANGELNDIDCCLEAEVGAYLDNVPGKAHLIVCNIVSDAIIEFSHQAYSSLLPGGKFIVSGIILEREEEVKTRLQDVGFVPLETLVRGQWVAIAVKKIGDRLNGCLPKT